MVRSLNPKNEPRRRVRSIILENRYVVLGRLGYQVRVAVVFQQQTQQMPGLLAITLKSNKLPTRLEGAALLSAMNTISVVAGVPSKT